MGKQPDDGDTARLTMPGARQGQAPAGDGCLVVIAGEGLGTRLDLGRPRLLIGRAHDADILFPHASVSRQHCEVRCDAAGCRITDLGATNPVRVNDHVLTAGQTVPLVDGDLVLLGASVLKYIAAGSIEARYHEEAYEVATRDPLTTLHNRRFFLAALDHAIAHARHLKRPLALAILDVDDFKHVNDRHGHLAGDSVLRRLAVLLREQVRDGTVIGRIGGEEFGVLLPDAGLEAGTGFSERLRAQVEAARIGPPGGRETVTVSIGVAVLAPGDDRSALLRTADAALYAAKRAGRNRVEIA